MNTTLEEFLQMTAEHFSDPRSNSRAVIYNMFCDAFARADKNKDGLVDIE